MVNYNLGKIYKIKCNVTGQIYIGSTCEKTVARRLAGHVKNYKSYLNGKYNNVSSFKVLENGDYYIVLLESVNCANNDELKAKERFHIENNICVNKCIPGRTRKEYMKEHYQSNKEKIQKYQKEYTIANKEKISEQEKEYRQANIEKIIEYQKEYRQANKENIHCECGSSFSRLNKNRHLKSQKHCNYIKNKDT